MDAISNHTLDLCDTLQERSSKYGVRRKFQAHNNRKYIRVVAEEITVEGKVIQRSAHCFVDKVNGNVYKAASWSSPAKGARYNLLDPDSKDLILRSADPLGIYLCGK